MNIKSNYIYFVIMFLGIFISIALYPIIIKSAEVSNGILGQERSAIDSLLENKDMPFYFGHFDQNQKDNIKVTLKKTGQIGLDYLIEKSMNIKSKELWGPVLLIGLFSHTETNGDKIVDLLKYRGVHAKDDYDLSICLSFYSNLGFFQPTEKILNFLLETVADKDSQNRDWPILKETIDKGNNQKLNMEVFRYSIRSCAATALFHIQSPEALAFLNELRNDPSETHEFRNMLNFHFDILKNYKSLLDYAKEKQTKEPIIE